MSYKKQEFILYMQERGNLNPGGYCNGLDNIEKIFSVDIEKEFIKDQCLTLYNHIQEIRKNPELIKKNEHDVRTYASRLKKYIEFRKNQENKTASFSWIPFYEEFATKLLAYKNNRKELLEIIESCFMDLSLEYPFKRPEKEICDDIDPFTIYGSFNKGIKEENRIAIIKKYKTVFDVNAVIPKDFDGIPVLMNMSSWFFTNKKNRNYDDIDNLWELFETALLFADGDDAKKELFINVYNKVITQKQVRWNITMGLYWIRPSFFLSLDSVSRMFLPTFNPPVGLTVACHELPNGKEYLDKIKLLKDSFVNGNKEINTFYEISHAAFQYALHNNKKKESVAFNDEESIIDDKETNLMEDDISSTTELEIYTKEDFLSQVYISEEKYETCVSRLKNKKNLILQGAPGVGKTFTAKRLAWSIMGVKDNSRIEFVQFHQSYSYEDFIMGYKPIENGFRLENGIFYEFCKKAELDSENEYFFIIDEINRGNMSKVFGELLMLIEKDYREMEIKLAYSKEVFSIPKNLYIIGMMNTADRSLAMIDYALRRRFSFVEMLPGFDSDGFKNYILTIKNNKLDKLITRIKMLNSEIENDESLGKGFCIGHSYFCNLDTECDDTVLREIVKYDIIPMLEEYWFDDKVKVKSWSDDLCGVIND